VTRRVEPPGASRHSSTTAAAALDEPLAAGREVEHGHAAAAPVDVPDQDDGRTVGGQHEVRELALVVRREDPRRPGAPTSTATSAARSRS
jgi:hypothetical protein